MVFDGEYKVDLDILCYIQYSRIHAPISLCVNFHTTPVELIGKFGIQQVGLDLFLESRHFPL